MESGLTEYQKYTEGVLARQHRRKRRRAVLHKLAVIGWPLLCLLLGYLYAKGF